MPIVLAYEEPVPSSTPAHAIMPPPSAVPLAFDAVAQLPAPLDNAAIAKEDLEAGQLISHASTTIRLSALVLEGHRFAVAPIGLGELITSWGEPFRCLACSTERLRQRIWPPQRAFRFGAPLSRRSTPSSRDGVE